MIIIDCKSCFDQRDCNIWIISAKLATPDLLKIAVFWNKVLTSHYMSMTSSIKSYHVTQIILYMWYCDQSLVTQAFRWGSYHKDLTGKNDFSDGWPWFKFNNLGLVLGLILKIYSSVWKGLIKSQKVVRMNSYI